MPEAPDSHQLPSQDKDRPPGPERGVIMAVVAVLVVIGGALLFMLAR